jgi:hypothetical protein
MSSDAVSVAVSPMSRVSLLQTLRLQANRPWFAYLTLVVLQSKLLWGIWSYRDLTSGDTTDYFRMAYLWHDHFLVDIVWSPLYTAFYGTLIYISNDAFVVTTLHRVIIVLTLSILVLALMRRLLPAGLAWLIAAWWVVLPINFNALYEVHLFAVIPVLAAWLLILSRNDRWGRGGGLAILCATTLLVRNELIVAVSVLAVSFLIWEWRLARAARAHGNPAARPRDYLTAYGLPLILAGLICLFFYSRSVTKIQDLQTAGAPKHTINMCQVYAFGYQQRHPEWTKSPWTQCYELMTATFGDKLVPLSDMIRRNPGAVLEHFLWNVSLTPNGLQVLLFNATSGTVNPDYAPVTFGSNRALVLSILLLGVLITGGVMLYRERKYWWEHWLRERAGGWLAMLAVSSVALLIIPTQRPRPSYLFSLGIVIMALTGMCLFIIVRRFSALKYATAALPALMVAAPILLPSFYSQPEHRQPRQLLTLYQRLVPFEQSVARPDTVLLVSSYPTEISNLIAHVSLHYRDVLQITNTTQIYDYGIINQAAAGTPVTALLDQYKVNFFYVDDNMWGLLSQQPQDRSLLESPKSRGWKMLAMQNQIGDHWMLLQREQPLYQDAPILQTLNGDPDINPAIFIRELKATNVLPADGLFLGHGWYPFETYAGQTFRWVDNDAEIVVTAPSGSKQRIKLELETGPSLNSQPFTIQLLDAAGKVVSSADVPIRKQIILDLPTTAGTAAVYHLHVKGGGRRVPNDPRILNFRVFTIDWL